MKRNSRSLRNRGFSLIEVLVALAVVSIVSVGVIGAISGMTSHATRYREEIQMSFLLRALSSDIILRGVPRNPTGSFDTHPDYTWRVVVGEAYFDDGSNTLARIEKKELTMTVVSPSGYSMSGTLLR